MKITHARVLGAGLGLVALLLAGCGGGSGSGSDAGGAEPSGVEGSVTPSGSGTTAGLSTTGDAAQAMAASERLMAAIFAGDWSATCPLYVADTAQQCRDAVGDASLTSLKYKGSARAVGAVVQGDRALVALVGKVCASTQGQPEECRDNDDPSDGLPTGEKGFDEVFEDTGSGMSPMAFQRVDGKWLAT